MVINYKSAGIGLAVAGISMLAGLFCVMYVSIVHGNLMLAAAPPIAVIGLILLILDKRTMFLLVMVFRSSGDLVFSYSQGGGGLGLGAVFNLLVILIAFMFVLERPHLLNKTIFSIWGGVLLIAIVGILRSPDLFDGIRWYFTLLTNFSVFVIAFYLVRSEKDLQLVINTILLSSIVPVIYGIVETGLNIGQIGSDAMRIKSTFGHPNIFAFYLVLNISLIFLKIKTLASANQAKRIFMFLYMFILVALLLVTKTRSAWAGCFVFFAIYAAMFERKYLVYLLVAPLLALFIAPVRERLLDLNHGNDVVQYAKLNSYAWRKLLWETALGWMTFKGSIIGYGINSFKFYSPIFFPLAGGIHWGAHSALIQWYFETGLVGVIAAVWMYFRILFTLKKGFIKDKLGSFLGIVLVIEYLVFAYSDNLLDYLSFNWYFWLFVGAFCSIIMIRNSSKDEAPDTEKTIKEKQVFS